VRKKQDEAEKQGNGEERVFTLPIRRFRLSKLIAEIFEGVG